MGLNARFHRIATTSNYLVLSSFVVLIALLLRSNGLSAVNVAIGAGVILVANFVFVVSGIVLPDLVGTGKVRFPLNVTLPAVFTAWLVVVAYLSRRTGNPLEPTIEPVRNFMANFRESDIAWYFLGQVAILSMVATLSARRMVGESVDSP